MCQDYKNGGFRMTNYRLSIKAQRICWVRRLLYGNKDMGWDTQCSGHTVQCRLKKTHNIIMYTNVEYSLEFNSSKHFSDCNTFCQNQN